jgi:hypothetical protein
VIAAAAGEGRNGNMQAPDDAEDFHKEKIVLSSDHGGLLIIPNDSYLDMHLDLGLCNYLYVFSSGDSKGSLRFNQDEEIQTSEKLLGNSP